MEFLTLTPENLEQEHICCALSGNNDCQVASKKAWLRDRMAEGLIFRRADARGKCFIEYLPAEAAFAPVTAPGFLYIDCLWVSGQLSGHGYAGELLRGCLEDARVRGKAGVVTLSSDKKRPFLSDPGFLKAHGFRRVDTAAPFFELLALPFSADAELPAFCPSVRHPEAAGSGFTLYYTAQCPYTAKYVPLLAAQAASRGAPLRTVRLDTAAEARLAPSPYTAFSLFRDGRFLTHEILSEKKMDALLTKEGF